MLVIPFELPTAQALRTQRGPIIVIIILEDVNLERMKQADPADLKLAAYAKYIPLRASIRDLDFVIAYEQDTERILAFKEASDIPGLIKWIERGRIHMPGDAEPPVPVIRKANTTE